MPDRHQIVQFGANLATIAAAIAAIVALVFGYAQFKATQVASRETLQLEREVLQQERESRAVELLVKYNELMGETPPSVQETEKVFWRGNLAVGISESIFKLTRSDEGWRETVRWMLSNHVDFLHQFGMDCRTFDDEFESLASEVARRSVCVDPAVSSADTAS